MKEKEVILCKFGEIVLKGANRSGFESMLTRELRRRAAHFGEAGNVLHISLPHTKEELGFHFGRGSVAIMALADAGLAATLVDKLAAMDPERYSPAAEQLRVKADKMLQRQREKRQHEKNLRMGKVRRDPKPSAPAEDAPAKPKKTPSAPPAAAKSFKKAQPAARPGSEDKRRTAPSFKAGPGGRKLSGKFRKP